jgi:hypothetical protein
LQAQLLALQQQQQQPQDAGGDSLELFWGTGGSNPGTSSSSSASKSSILHTMGQDSSAGLPFTAVQVSDRCFFYFVLLTVHRRRSERELVGLLWRKLGSRYWLGFVLCALPVFLF